RVLDTVKVEEVIGDFVTLKRQGANYLACCPFHNEKTPSFTVSPARGFYYCFGCKKGGTAVSFLMDHERMTFSDAIRFLGKKYGIEIKEEEESAETIAARQKSESLYIVSEFAQNYFAQQLESGEGRALGYAYFKSRGLEDETIRKFGLGWCPTDRYALLNAARAAGHKEEYLVESGLCIKTEEGKIYDRFHERVTFPLHSVSGRVLGFSSRTLRSDKTVAKYVNSPQTDIYDKSKFLYGIWFAKQQIAKEDSCILVEGNLDMISMHQLGLTNVVASCGTSLTVDQIRLIKRFTSNVTIIYDGDAAGIHAALRGIGLVLKEGLNVKVVLLPDGMDPDDFTKTHTLEQVRQFISDNAKDFIGFKADLLLDEAGNDPLKKAELINDVADTIALIPDAVKRAVYTESCAQKFGIAQEILSNRVYRTHEGVLEEDKRRWERERAEQERRNAQNPQAQEQTEIRTVHLDGAVGKKTVAKPSILEPVEKDLLKFIFTSGLDLMEFTRDSKYYTEPPMTVAEFIDSSLQDDDALFEDGARRRAYDSYFEYYDEGLSQDEILRRMTSGEDQEIVNLVVELTASRYELTEKNLRNSMTKPMTILVQQVPRAILLYHVRRLDKQLEEYKAQLRNPDVDAMMIMTEIAHLNEMRRKLNTTLGRN
ncbi:MAG: DNA primase, partial [Bacteroidales bacterium]|nr:DNA primase [Bacteroidales bacterium]